MQWSCAFRLAVGLAVAMAVAWPDPAEACKYSVRDVGFVDSDGPAFQLVLLTKKALEPSVIDKWRQAIRPVLADANIVFAAVASADEPNHPALKVARATDTPALWLFDPRSGRAAAIALPLDAAGQVDWSRLGAALTALADSPARQAMARHLPAGLAVLVLIEGSDSASNARARATADRVIDQLGQVLGRLEKPVKKAPLLVTIRAADRDNESWLLWGLGLPVEQEKEARLAVVFGRFRRSGPVLQGQQVEPVSLFSQVATLGRSCECSLDRAATFGPVVPHLWALTERKAVAGELGFDPEDPLVKAEINGILAKAPVAEPKGNSGKLTYEELLLGFRETPLDEDDPKPVKDTPAKSKGKKMQVVRPEVAAPIAVTVPAGAPDSLVWDSALWTLAAILAGSASLAALVFFWRARRA